ncbi:hypothetical protein EDD17DRAFT_1617757 [Pisolithus thermaeus]|nr:hypothetical protein EDD17DRAFT_1617757 [Pisolithus thermaeus]
MPSADTIVAHAVLVVSAARVTGQTSRFKYGGEHFGTTISIPRCARHINVTQSASNAASLTLFCLVPVIFHIPSEHGTYPELGAAR